MNRVYLNIKKISAGSAIAKADMYCRLAQGNLELSQADKAKIMELAKQEEIESEEAFSLGENASGKHVLKIKFLKDKTAKRSVRTVTVEYGKERNERNNSNAILFV